MECHSQTLKNNLFKYFSEELPEELHCDIINCSTKKYHSRDSHHCINCKRHHSENECIIQTYEYWKDYFQNQNNSYFPNFNEEEFKTNYFGKYIELSLGLGCELFVKNDANVLMGLFMHSDNWGQYGPDTDDTSIYHMFIEGFQYIEIEDITNNENNISTLSINCPLCRTVNDKNNIMEIKGSSDKCKICFENYIELYFPNCMHACCCKDCFNNL
jgi:hypothetical protein